MLKLMYITSSPQIALIAEKSGVDRIFVDMEYIGKADRQGGMNTVQSHHTVEDVKKIADVLTSAELLARINPIHSNSKQEIEKVIAAGADILMLPYFKTVSEVKEFLSLVNGRAETMLLFETTEAVKYADEILSLEGIDFVHIGINDLSLGYGKKFMFELLIDGTVEKLCEKFKSKGIPYGFGGIASLGKGLVPAEMVIAEHYRLGSKCAILSRSFCNADEIKDVDLINNIFSDGLQEIRSYEKECESGQINLTENQNQICKAIKRVVNG